MKKNPLTLKKIIASRLLAAFLGVSSSIICSVAWTSNASFEDAILAILLSPLFLIVSLGQMHFHHWGFACLMIIGAGSLIAGIIFRLRPASRIFIAAGMALMNIKTLEAMLNSMGI